MSAIGRVSWHHKYSIVIVSCREMVVSFMVEIQFKHQILAASTLIIMLAQYYKLDTSLMQIGKWFVCYKSCQAWTVNTRSTEQWIVNCKQHPTHPTHDLVIHYVVQRQFHRYIHHHLKPILIHIFITRGIQCI